MTAYPVTDEGGNSTKRIDVFLGQKNVMDGHMSSAIAQEKTDRESSIKQIGYIVSNLHNIHPKLIEFTYLGRKPKDPVF